MAKWSSGQVEKGRGVAKVKRYQDLIAWQKAYNLVLAVYACTKEFPSDERFGLTQQLRRAAVSVPSNIAEGWGRRSRTELIRFLEMARGSCYEVQTQTKLASDLGYVSHHHDVHSLIGDTERLITGLIESLKRKND